MKMEELLFKISTEMIGSEVLLPLLQEKIIRHSLK
jgi:hypothetical protein